MSADIELTPSLEDYLEAIYHIIEEKRVARSKDISAEMKVKSASVTSALQTLADKKLINYAPYEVITLTRNGQKRAREIIHKHRTFKKFFMRVLDIDPQDADETACRFEHEVGDNVFEKFELFNDFLEDHAQSVEPLIEEFKVYCQKKKAPGAENEQANS